MRTECSGAGVAAMDDSRQLNLHEDPGGRPDGEAGRFERANELAHILAHGGCGIRKMIAY
jgi:hypothetical protein